MLNRFCIKQIYVMRRSEINISRLFLSTVKNENNSEKVAKKKKKGGDNDETTLIERANIFFKTAERIKRRKEEFSDEEKAEHKRIGNEYNRQSFIRHNKYDKDLALKIWLMHEALDALPKELQVHANTISDDEVPANRPFPGWHTPPVKGFDFQEYSKYSGSDDNA